MTKQLSERDRRFFALVARAAFANPFGEERAALDAEIGETSADDPEVLARISARLGRRIESLTERGTFALANYHDADRQLLWAALLFAAFHRFMDDIDALIERPGRVRFAPSLLGELTERGVAPEQALRALELFYQIRRAHLAIGSRLIGAGPSMRKLRAELWNSVFTHDILRYERYLWSRMQDFSTLLLGETGTGKGEAARAIGQSGFIPFDPKRGEFAALAESLFVPVHLSEYPDTLIESELFGHRRGAFTGAIDHHEGALARVHPHGVLFLDEIGEVRPEVQVKLLRVLQDRAFTPVGAHEQARFHGRVVAATHRSLPELRSAGSMRHDFYYRLSTLSIEVPALRTRIAENPGELRSLIEHICARIVGEHSLELASTVHDAIVRELGPHYGFPGNVRELEQCVRRVLLTGHCDADRALPRDASGQLAARIERGELDVEALVRSYCEHLYARTKSYVQVAKLTGLDRRTVRRYLRTATESDRSAS